MLTERLISSELHVEGPTPARYWGDQWLRVAEKILKGLNHELSDRVASLDASTGQLAPEQPVAAAVVEVVRDDVTLLHHLLALYRSLTTEAIAAPEPTRLQDVVPLVVRLHEHHGDLRVVQCQVRADPDTEPVLVRQAAFTRCVLVLLASVAGNTLRSGAPRLVTMEFGTEGPEVVMRFMGSAPRDQLLFSGEGSLLHAVRAALAHAGGTVEGAVRRTGEHGHLMYEMRLPALSTIGTAVDRAL